VFHPFKEPFKRGYGTQEIPTKNKVYEVDY